MNFAEKTQKIIEHTMKFQELDKYARWLDDKKRRETWPETVQRITSFLLDIVPESMVPEIDEIHEAILTNNVMPSMRVLMTAGEALRRDNAAAYNCSYLPIDCIKAFSEVLYLGMCGCGVGFSVEKENITQLPCVPELYPTETIIVPADSRIGWATSLHQLLSLLYEGFIPSWNLSKIRPKGARLRTFGGKASGPEPLNELFHFVVDTFKKAVGRKLTSIEVHDIVCMIGQCVISGGVRRTALISLSDLDDYGMANAKIGSNWPGHRSYANNSAVYEQKPSLVQFLDEFNTLIKSNSGERGIFNRKGAIDRSIRIGRMLQGIRVGANPCGEIILMPTEFCNLTEIVIRSCDTLETVMEKVRIATIIGTIQSSLTDFRFLRKSWKKNCEEERLLGVSLTGIYDHPFFAGIQEHIEYNKNGELKVLTLPEALKEMHDNSWEINKKYAEILGINPSKAITCIKPSGNVSTKVNSASGIHPRWADYYVRSCQVTKTSEVNQLLIDSGVPYEELSYNKEMNVFSFPVKAPEGAITRKDVTAIQHLELAKIYSDFWCDHNPSITVNVKESEWIGVADWVYKNFDKLVGITFMPYDDSVYKQAPYMEISEKEYLKLVEQFPDDIPWDELVNNERYLLDTDQTEGNRMGSACSSGFCEI